MSEAFICSQLLHSPCSSGALLSTLVLQRVYSGVRQESVYGCCMALPLCRSPHTSKLLTTSLFFLPLSVHLWMSLSLPLSLRQYKSRHVPTRHQQPDRVHEPAPRPRGGGAEDRRGGKPRKKIPSMTQPASVG